MPAEFDDFLCPHSVDQWMELFSVLIVISHIYGANFSNFSMKRWSFLDFVMSCVVPFTSYLGPGVPHFFFWLEQLA